MRLRLVAGVRELPEIPLREDFWNAQLRPNAVMSQGSSVPTINTNLIVPN